MLDPSLQHVRLDDYDAFIDLLEPLFHHGELVQEHRSIHQIRKDAVSNVLDFYQMHGDKNYPVGLEKKLFELKQQLIDELRKPVKKG